MVSDPRQDFAWKWFYPRYPGGNLKTIAVMPSLAPTAADRNGVFTGSVMSLPFTEAESGGAEKSYYPTAFYASVWGAAENRQETISIARALKADLIDANGKPEDPFLTDWTKYSTNVDDPNNNPEVETKEAITGSGDFECGAVYRLTDRIGTTNGTPFIMIFGPEFRLQRLSYCSLTNSSLYPTLVAPIHLSEPPLLAQSEERHRICGQVEKSEAVGIDGDLVESGDQGVLDRDVV
jgi:hypothetical protein